MLGEMICCAKCFEPIAYGSTSFPWKKYTDSYTVLICMWCHAEITGKHSHHNLPHLILDDGN